MDSLDNNLNDDLEKKNSRKIDNKSSKENNDFENDFNEIECFLEKTDLWHKFHEIGNEMMITNLGRRVFPPLCVSFNGAKKINNNNDNYIIAMDIVPADSIRYRYSHYSSSWLVVGKADPPLESKLCIYPHGPFTSELLYKHIVSFEKVKITNNEMDKSGHIILNTMHKYQPRFHLIKIDDSSKFSHEQVSLQVSKDLETFEYKTFIFPETSFIAVTAYQNRLVSSKYYILFIVFFNFFFLILRLLH